MPRMSRDSVLPVIAGSRGKGKQCGKIDHVLCRVLDYFFMYFLFFSFAGAVRYWYVEKCTDIIPTLADCF